LQTSAEFFGGLELAQAVIRNKDRNKLTIFFILISLITL